MAAGGGAGALIGVFNFVVSTCREVTVGDGGQSGAKDKHLADPALVV